MTSDEIVINVNRLTKSFSGKIAVRDLSLQVKRGEIFGFLGPNGSGKTTTLRMLCGLLTPDSGTGTCLGYDILTQSYQIKTHVGYMTQRFSLYEDLTVYENLDFIARLYHLNDRKFRVEKSIEESGFLEKQNQLAGSLSGGWKQRLALSAALIHEPSLLLLDEPTAGVDPKARRDFWDHIYRLAAKGVTTLVSTHYMDEAERCNRLAYLAYGDLLAEGTANDIIAHTRLITWVVTGPHLFSLSETLKNLPGIDQSAVFGDTLHVSGKDSALLAQTIAPFQKDPQYQWEPGHANLEDVFISLVGSEGDLRQ